MTSNCAGITSGCTVNTATGFDVAQLPARLRRLEERATCSTPRPTPRSGRSTPSTCRTTSGSSSKLTLNVGLRWDVYVPWVEVDDRQSNFDESHRASSSVASDDAVIDGVKVGRYLQTYSKGDLGPRFGFAYDLTGDGRTVVRGGVGVFWNFTPGGTSSSKAQNPPFLQSTALTTRLRPTTLTRVRRAAAASGRRPEPPLRARAATRSIFDVNFRDAY